MKLLIGLFAFILAGFAWADSFWMHNGSLMRLKSQGTYRVISYEVPSQRMRSAGVSRGTVLFEGYRYGDEYTGYARVFSKYCNGPQLYEVGGWASTNDRVIVLGGERDSYSSGCIPNGNITYDKLVFTLKE